MRPRRMPGVNSVCLGSPQSALFRLRLYSIDFPRFLWYHPTKKAGAKALPSPGVARSGGASLTEEPYGQTKEAFPKDPVTFTRRSE